MLSFAFLSGRVPPAALTEALMRDLVFAAPGTILVLREGDALASPALLAGRGVPRLLYRLGVAPEVAAEDAVREGWLDGIVDDAEDAERRVVRRDLSPVARRAARNLLQSPSCRAALALERAEFALIQSAADKQEGIRAFFERRPPNFGSR